MEWPEGAFEVNKKFEKNIDYKNSNIFSTYICKYKYLYVCYKLFEEGIIDQKIMDWIGKKDASNCDLENDVRLFLKIKFSILMITFIIFREN